MNSVVLLLLCTSFVWAYNAAEYCSGLVQCTGYQSSVCSDSLSQKNEDIEYDSTFCSLYTEVAKRGITASDPKNFELYSNLGIEHRVEYVIKGDLPISKKMLDFLISDIPHTALLINAYQETEYEARYTTFDHKTFYGANGGSLQGTVTELADEYAKRNITYFGFGIADVLFWSLKGTVLLFFEFQSTGPKEITYALTITVFNHSSIINGIMDLGMFRSVVHSKIETIITHIQESAQEYAIGNFEPITEYEKLNTELSKEFLRKLLQVDAPALPEITPDSITQSTVLLSDSAVDTPSITVKDLTVKENTENIIHKEKNE